MSSTYSATGTFAMRCASATSCSGSTAGGTTSKTWIASRLTGRSRPSRPGGSGAAGAVRRPGPGAARAAPPAAPSRLAKRRWSVERATPAAAAMSASVADGRLLQHPLRRVEDALAVAQRVGASEVCLGLARHRPGRRRHAPDLPLRTEVKHAVANGCRTCVAPRGRRIRRRAAGHRSWDDHSPDRGDSDEAERERSRARDDARRRDRPRGRAAGQGQAGRGQGPGAGGPGRRPGTRPRARPGGPAFDRGRRAGPVRRGRRPVGGRGAAPPGQGRAGARYAEQAADRAERLGGYLHEADGDRILRDVEDFGRRRPWAVVAGGLALGFMASRLLKASSSERYRLASQPAAPQPSRVNHDRSAMTARSDNELRDRPTGELLKELSDQTTTLGQAGDGAGQGGAPGEGQAGRPRRGHVRRRRTVRAGRLRAR